MKKILVVGLALALSAGLTNQLYAQSESTALSLAQQHDARGSARYQALSGAIIIGKTKRERFRQRSVCNYKGFLKNEAYAKNLRTQGFYLIIYLLFKQEEIFFLRKTALICA